jgi:hypothetical protein
MKNERKKCEFNFEEFSNKENLAKAQKAQRTSKETT